MATSRGLRHSGSPTRGSSASVGVVAQGVGVEDFLEDGGDARRSRVVEPVPSAVSGVSSISPRR